MKMNLDNVNNIVFCYENGEGDIIEKKHILAFNIKRKLNPPKTIYNYKSKATHRIKTFEIALQNIDYSLRTDLAQLIVKYNDNSYDHFFMVWGNDDCCWDHSSLQKVHKKNNIVSLTSNCESEFVNL